jgi:heme/copper-type cytochrome/quinol oxidase subunit 3
VIAHCAFFAALFAVMFYLRWASEEWPAPFHFASLIMVVALTLFAISGSATLEMASRAAKLNDSEPAVRWVAVGIASWLTFLFLEVVEWVRLVYLVKLGPDTAFGGTFLALTGAHWIAVCACVSWMTVVASDVRRRDVVAVSLYAHFLNVLWIVLVFTLYLANFTLGEI